MRPFALLVALACFVTAGQAATDPAQVVTGQGAVKGISDKTHRVFLSVPYAAPPVGALRWAAPQPPANRASTLDGTVLRDKCTQISWRTPKVRQGSEDCLYLNIYTPSARRTSKPLPVMVWFHGGGLVAGSSQDSDGSVLAARGDIIVVTVNYRLGAFGFFASPALDAEDAGHASGNYAIRDQQAALRWIRDNIAAFGGDPGRVTIAGQSAGAISVWVHLVSPGSAGLFHGAIAQSWPALIKSYSGAPYMRGVGGTQPLKAEQEQGASSRLFTALGCQAEADPLACARSKDAETVLNAINPAAARTLGWGVVIDGVVLPDSVLSLIERGQHRKVPILTGYNEGDMAFFTIMTLASGGKMITEEQYVAQLKALPKGEKILAEYPASKYSSAEDARTAALGDAMTCSSWHSARVVSAVTPFYLYEFADLEAPPTIFDIAVPPTLHSQAFHTAELNYIFQTGYPNELQPGTPPFKPAQKALSDRMLRYWASFVKNGKPAPDQRWPAFSASPGAYLLQPEGDKLLGEQAFDARHRCSFWRS